MRVENIIRKIVYFSAVSLIVFSCFFLYVNHIYIKGLFLYKEFKSQNYAAYLLDTLPKLTNIEAVNLSVAHSSSLVSMTPHNSYIYKNYKNDTVKRIGVFGCSYVKGEESDDFYDFPYLLEKKLNKPGQHYEVINFGVPSYGISQSYRLYGELSNIYKLDVIIFNPYLLHIPRDLSFQFYNLFYPIHGRHIVENDSLKYIEIKASSRKKAMESYYSFFQDKKYIIYDSKPPFFLRALGIKKNPFYFTMQTEVKEFLTILNKINDTEFDKGKKIVWMCNEETVFNTLSSNKIFTPDSILNINKSLYFAPKLHYSPYGNDVKAQQVFNYINQSSGLTLFKYTWIKPTEDKEKNKLSKPFKNVKNIKLLNNAINFGNFYSKDEHYPDTFDEFFLKNRIVRTKKIDSNDLNDKFFLNINSDPSDSKWMLISDFDFESYGKIELEIEGKKVIIGNYSNIFNGFLQVDYFQDIDLTISTQKKQRLFINSKEIKLSYSEGNMSASNYFVIRTEGSGAEIEKLSEIPYVKINIEYLDGIIQEENLFKIQTIIFKNLFY